MPPSGYSIWATENFDIDNVMEQEKGNDRVIAYGSKVLTPTEQRYAQIVCEALAV